MAILLLIFPLHHDLNTFFAFSSWSPMASSATASRSGIVQNFHNHHHHIVQSTSSFLPPLPFSTPTLPLSVSQVTTPGLGAVVTRVRNVSRTESELQDIDDFLESDDERKDQPELSENSKKKKKKSKYKKRRKAVAIAEKTPESDLDASSSIEDNVKEVGSEQPAEPLIKLDDVNPVGLGRRSRQMFDQVWRRFSGLGQMSAATVTSEQSLLDPGIDRWPMSEFVVPGAQDTTILLVGATSRIGRIVVRKLTIRGYKVKVSISNLIHI